MSNVQEFKRQVETFKAKVRSMSEQRNRRIILYLFTLVNTETPVREGVLRENWELHPDYPGATFVRERAHSPGEAVAMAMRRIASERINGRRWYFSNRTAYAFRIEFGYSVQKPGGMVRVSVRRVVGLIRRGAL
ncbi:MAG TPA: hypothetical protein DEB39_09315 [Planctomycetaceae bacterium]|nr:hypothetical protein [Planctomycetaceae bacterium]